MTKNETLLGDLRGGLCSSGLCKQLRSVAADEIERLQRELAVNQEFHNIDDVVEIRKLRNALRYWLPDEAMIPKGHEVAWNEHVELIPEHRRSPSEPSGTGCWQCEGKGCPDCLPHQPVRTTAQHSPEK